MTERKAFDMEQSKTCNDCKQIKLFSEFHNNKVNRDGKASYCKICLLARGAEYRKNNPAKVKETNRFSKQKNKSKANKVRKIWVDKNRDKVNAQKRQWNAANKNKVRQINQNSYAKNRELFIQNAQKRYAKLKGVEQKKITIKEIKKLYSLPCIYCGSTIKIEIDHIIPVSRGGRNALGNLAPACLKCNRSKSDLFVMEWKKRETKNPPQK